MKAGILILVLCAIAFGIGTLITSPKAQACTNTKCGVDEFKKLIDSGEYKLIDIRTADEYAAGHLANADQIDYYQTERFEKYLESLEKNGKYLIYCRSGNRSGQALKIMKQKGFMNVSDLAGGITAWTNAGFKTSVN